ncbi:MAG: hypothetical protein COA79_02385 [Planctomycetota bacterium]|nr:MAG: hypothetical protein COA79_02385 [Planctomycetota bacterium]
MRFCCFTDVHIHDHYSLIQSIELLNNIKQKHSPDLFVGLGDFFDNKTDLLEFGAQFKLGLDNLKTEYLMVYGNHDGANDSYGGEGSGWDSFQKIFGKAQEAQTIQGHHFVTLGDMEQNSNWETFYQENITDGSMVFCHGPLSQNKLDSLSQAGARLVFHGHLHMSVKMLSTNKKCEQIGVSSFRFGGMDRTPPGCAIIDLKDDKYNYTWAISKLPKLDGTYIDNNFTTKKLDFYYHKDENRFLQQKELRFKDQTFIGSYYAIQCWKDESLQWETKNGGPAYHDLCPLSYYEWKDKLYLFAGGTWVSSNNTYKSLRVLDGYNGNIIYDIPIIGLSVPPSKEEGVVYAVGQYRELIAFFIETGEIIWSITCETESESLLWRDNRFGGGWSVTPAMIGEHIWVANFRGDLFGVDKRTGNIKFIHKGILPIDNDGYGVYAYTLGFVSQNISREIDSDGNIIFNFNGLLINDRTGEILE